jgi:hypothetical protein
MNRKFTFFDVESDLADDVLAQFQNSEFEGRRLRVNEGESRGGGGGRGRRKERKDWKKGGSRKKWKR